MRILVKLVAKILRFLSHDTEVHFMHAQSKSHTSLLFYRVCVCTCVIIIVDIASL